MRRSEKEIRDLDVIEGILRSERVVNLAMVVDDESYVVPMFFGYADRALFLHSGAAGKKIDAIAKHPRVSFSVSETPEVVESDTACRFGARYRSVCGTGLAVIIDDPEQKRVALDTIMSKFSSRERTYGSESLRKTTVIRVDIETMSGKQSGY